MMRGDAAFCNTSHIYHGLARRHIYMKNELLSYGDQVAIATLDQAAPTTPNL